MQEIKDKIYAAHDLVMAGKYSLEQLNLTGTECVQTVIEEALHKIDEAVDLIDEKGVGK